MASPPVFYDKHTLKITTGPLDSNTVTEALQVTLNFVKEQWSEITSAAGISDNDSKRYLAELQACTFRVNVVSTVATNFKPAVMFGFAYVWVSSVVFYNLLCGKTPDGSPSLTKAVDPELQDKLGFDPTNFNLNVKGPALDLFLSKGYQFSDWADKTRFKEEMEDLVNSNTVTTQNPLVHMAQVEYSKDQKVIILNASKNKKNEVPDAHTFLVEGAYVEKTDGVNQRTLVANNIQSWVEPKMVESLFKSFGTDHKTHRKRVNDNNKITYVDVTYPIIRKQDYTTNKGIKCHNLFVEFSPDLDHATDAAFARLVARQIHVKNPETGDLSTLIFNFWENSKNNNTTTVNNVNTVKPPKYGTAPSNFQHIIASDIRSNNKTNYRK